MLGAVGDAKAIAGYYAVSNCLTSTYKLNKIVIIGLSLNGNKSASCRPPISSQYGYIYAAYHFKMQKSITFRNNYAVCCILLTSMALTTSGECVISLQSIRQKLTNDSKRTVVYVVLV